VGSSCGIERDVKNRWRKCGKIAKTLKPFDKFLQMVYM